MKYDEMGYVAGGRWLVTSETRSIRMKDPPDTFSL